jgi:ketosteroid isomerase-like protein
MKRLLYVAPLLLVPAIAVWAQTGKYPDIDKVRTAYTNATESGNLASLMMLYQSDAVVMPPEMPSVKGKTDIEAFHKKMMGMATMSNVNISPTHTEVSGDTAIDVGTYSQSVKPKSGSTMAAHTETGKYIVILKKQPDSSWKVAYEIYNTDKPMTMPSTR